MAYPQTLFMQREEELPDPNVDPIGYAEAVARLERKRGSGGGKRELAPQDLDPLEAAAAPLPMDPAVGGVPVANIPAPDMDAPMADPVAPMQDIAAEATPTRPDRNDHVARAMRIHGPNWGRFVAQSQLGGGRRTPQSIAAESLLNDMNPEWRQLANFFMLTGGPGKATTPMDAQMQQAQLREQMAMIQERNRGNLEVENVRADGRAKEQAGEEALAREKMEQDDRNAAAERDERKHRFAEEIAAKFGLQKNDILAKIEAMQLQLDSKNPNSDIARDLQGLQKDEMEAKRTQDAITWAEDHISKNYAWNRGLRNLVPWGSSEFTPRERADSLAALRSQFPWLKPDQAQQIIDSIAARKSPT